MDAGQPIHVGPQGRELPLTPELTKRFRELAAAGSEGGTALSPEQLASAVLDWALAHASPDVIKKLATDMRASEDAGK